jgi:hypothetical protein
VCDEDRSVRHHDAGDSPERRHHMRVQPRLLTRREIEDAERPAWALREGQRYHYDGINFWVADARSEHAVRPGEIPDEGWWHRGDCNCRYCRGDDA